MSLKFAAQKLGVWLTFLMLAVVFCLPQKKNQDRIHSGKKMTIPKLLNMPTSLNIAENQLHLQTYLWRDFQPIAPPEGKPLRAVIRITGEEGKPLPEGLQPEKIYIIYAEELWEAPLKNVSRAVSRRNQLSATAGNGPRWNTGRRVEVIVGFTDANGNIYYLRAPQQTIHRTY